MNTKGIMLSLLLNCASLSRNNLTDKESVSTENDTFFEMETITPKVKKAGLFP